MYRKYFISGISAVLLMFMLQACGSSGSTGSGDSKAMGAVSVALTDGPGDCDHVWITVSDIWFHKGDGADPGQQGGWIKAPLAAPVTVDLLTLGNGNAQSIWDSIALPAGTYKQIRLVLVDTEDPLTASAQIANNNATLKYNNEVVVNGVECPLHVPDARHGIRLIGAFNVTEGGTLKLAIDFDAGQDVVEFRNGQDYILKPRLAYFDLDNVGAIVGRISLSSGQSYTAPRFVIKAEQLNADGTYHMVKRYTTPDATGRFVLYPLSAMTATTYDLVLRGLDYQTIILKGVPVSRGATPTSGATDLGTIAMTAAVSPDYSLDGTITSPTGAWVSFYQTLQGAGEVPYEIRFRHFNPLNGTFPAFRLSSDQIQVASYMTSTIMSGLTATSPVGGNGVFGAVAGALMYAPGVPQLVSSGTVTVAFSSLSPKVPATACGISGVISRPSTTRAMSMDGGRVFAVHGGMIVDAIPMSSQMMSGGSYSLSNLPGGSTANPLTGAFYGVEAIGWSSTTSARAIAMPGIADLRTGDAAVDINLMMLP